MLLKYLTKSRQLLITPKPYKALSFLGTLPPLASKMAKRALVFLAAGAEEMEAVATVDVLRRGGVEVTIAGVPDGTNQKCSRDVIIKPDVSITDVFHMGVFDIMVLPGGLGGTTILSENPDVRCLLKEQEENMRFIAAICAAPLAVKKHEVCYGKTVTSYPSIEKDLTEGGYFKYKNEKVVRDDLLITSQGPATALDFALTLVEVLVGKAKATEVAKDMLHKY